jgi:hypothetical protein
MDLSKQPFGGISDRDRASILLSSSRNRCKFPRRWDCATFTGSGFDPKPKGTSCGLGAERHGGGILSDSTQGSSSLRGASTGPFTIKTSQGELVGPYWAVVPTSLSGLVMDTESDSAVCAVELVGANICPVTTDQNGLFLFTDSGACGYRIRFNSEALPRTLPNRHYPEDRRQGGQGYPMMKDCPAGEWKGPLPG